MIAVRLVMFSAFDLDAFLPIARQAVGHGVSEKADAEASGAELHNMMCVTGLISGEVEEVDQLFHIAYAIACDERDMPDVVSIAGMPHIWIDCMTRGIRMAIISGSIPGWRDAIRRGCTNVVGLEVRKIYNKIYKDLTDRKLDGIIGVATKRPQQDATFLLEFNE